MVIGVPKEIKNNEYRVGIVPAGVEELTRDGNLLRIESQAGVGSGISDDDFRAAGAEIVLGAGEVWKESDLVICGSHICGCSIAKLPRL